MADVKTDDCAHTVVWRNGHLPDESNYEGVTVDGVALRMHR